MKYGSSRWVEVTLKTRPWDSALLSTQAGATSQVLDRVWNHISSEADNYDDRVRYVLHERITALMYEATFR